MRRLLSDLMTPERFVHATRHALTSAQISSGGQKFGQKFSPAERTLARRPTRLLLSVEASSFSAAGRRGSGCVTRAGRAQTLRARPFPESEVGRHRSSRDERRRYALGHRRAVLEPMAGSSTDNPDALVFGMRPRNESSVLRELVPTRPRSDEERLPPAPENGHAGRRARQLRFSPCSEGRRRDRAVALRRRSPL